MDHYSFCGQWLLFRQEKWIVGEYRTPMPTMSLEVHGLHHGICALIMQLLRKSERFALEDEGCAIQKNPVCNQVLWTVLKGTGRFYQLDTTICVSTPTHHLNKIIHFVLYVLVVLLPRLAGLHQMPYGNANGYMPPP